jgi:Flp pilus assembly protein TadD
MSRDSLVEVFVGAALAASVLLVYSPSFSHGFVNIDDPSYVFQNPRVQTGLSADGTRWAFTTFDCGNWHPLTWLSLQLDSTLYGGPKPGGFHLTNVLLHAANTLLLFLVLGRMTGAVGRSAVVAALFALHPLHVESVAWVAERKDVLSTLFWMLTLAAYLHYVRRPGARRYLLVVLALGLGLMAKPMLVTLPCVLLLLDYWPLGRLESEIRNPKSETNPKTQIRNSKPRVTPLLDFGFGVLDLFRISSFRFRILEKLPLFALALASCGVTFLAQLRAEAVAPLEAFPLTVRVGNALLAYVGYLGKMLWPTRLAVYYPHPGAALSVAVALGAGVLLVVITVLVLGPGRRRPYLAVGWLWYVGTLVPVIGLVQVGGQAMADRYTYVPLIGVFLMLTWGAADLAAAWRLPRLCLIAAGAAVLFACAALTWVQVGYWKSSLELWARAAAVTDNNGLAHLNLGGCYFEQHMLSDAKREFERAAELGPGRAGPHAKLGTVLAELGRWEQAAAEYRRAIELEPETAWPHYNLGCALVELGRPEEAMAEFRKAGDLDPGDGSCRHNLGNVLRGLGRLEEAEAEYRRATDLDPASALAHNSLGSLLAELGRPEEAEAEYRRAIDLDPASALPHNNLGRAFQEAGRFEEALAEYRRARELGDEQAWPRLQDCERLRALRARLADLAAGRDRPADNAERLAFADLSRRPFEGRYALAARFYGEAFSADAQFADDLRAANRLRAAGAAAAAGCGQGQDAARLDETEKTRLRCQALNWLRADLAARTRQGRGDKPQDRAAAQQALRAWRRDADLAGVRDAAALARLPGAEREAWQKLWQEVEAALAKASAPTEPKASATGEAPRR